MSFGGSFSNQWLRWQNMRVSVITTQTSALGKVCLLSNVIRISLSFLCLLIYYNTFVLE